MVPYICNRGKSFKGAAQYYLHDKKASTSERVAWTHTVNLPTDNAEKAFGWMAHTAMNAEQLKKEAGIAATGRKSKAGAVYSYSLAWAPEQAPKQEDMLSSALETLVTLGLKDHEAVLVAHQEKEHKHVHIICNLINPQDGRIKVPSYDRLTLSAWAEAKEKEDGKIYCEERVLNNQKRREKGLDAHEHAIVKYREKKLEVARQIQVLYELSDSGKSFQSALEEQGFTLAKGDRRGFTLVDGEGKVYSLARQLEGQRAKDIKSRLADIDLSTLPDAKTVSQDRMYFDRDQYETDRQKAIVDAAIEQDGLKKKEVVNEAGQESEQKPERKSEQRSKGRTEQKPVQKQTEKSEYDAGAFLRELDEKRHFENQMQQRRNALEKKITEQYHREELLKSLSDAQKEFDKNRGFLGRITGKKQELEDKILALQKNLENTDQRIAEQRGALEKEISALNDKTFPSNVALRDENLENDIEKTMLAEDLEREYYLRHPDPDKSKGKDDDLDLKP